MRFIMLWLGVLCLVLETEGQKRNKDTVYVTTSYSTIVMFDQRDTVAEVDIGTKSYAGGLGNRYTVKLQAKVSNPEPTSLYIRYNGNKYYSGTIAYKAVLNSDERVVDFMQKDSVPTPINKGRAITYEKEPVEDQVLEARVNDFADEKKYKDRYKGSVAILDSKSKLSLKLSNSMQDERYLYLKFVMYNDSKVDFEIDVDGIDFLYVNRDNDREYKQQFVKGSNAVTAVGAKSFKTLIYALPKFTLTSKWKLSFSIKEISGTRKLVLDIPYERINGAEIFK